MNTTVYVAQITQLFGPTGEDGGRTVYLATGNNGNRVTEVTTEPTRAKKYARPDTAYKAAVKYMNENSFLADPRVKTVN